MMHFLSFFEFNQKVACNIGLWPQSKPLRESVGFSTKIILFYKEKNTSPNSPNYINSR